MRHIAWIAAVLFLPAAHAGQAAPAEISPHVRQVIRNVLLARMNADQWCTPGVDNGFVDDLAFEQVALADQPVILVSPGQGCAMGGQGANSELWLFSLVGTTPRLIGDPQHGLEGWFRGVLPAVHHGYHDVSIGWHYGADDNRITVFRFDGGRYRAAQTRGALKR